MKKLRLIQFIVGLLILVLLLFKIGGGLKALEKVEITTFLLSILMYDLLNVILSYRVYYLLKNMNYKPNFFCCLFANLGGMVAGDVTPGRSGYVLMAKLLERCGVPVSDAIAAVVAPQGIDFVVKGLGASLAILVLGFSNPWAGILVIAFGGIILMFMWYEKPSNLLKNFLPSRVLKILDRFGLSKVISDMLKSSVETRKYALQILVLCLIGWVFVGFQWFFVGQSCKVVFPIYVYFLLQPLLSALMFVPITPAGLGIMESGTVVVLYALGVPPEKATVFAILIRISCILADLPGVLAWLKK